MTDPKAAAEALQWAVSVALFALGEDHPVIRKIGSKADELRAQAAASPEPEPVAKVVHSANAYPFINPIIDVADLPKGTLLYAHPPADERVALLEGLLRDLHATVWGECPALLDELRDGDSNLDMRIRAALEG